MRELDPRIHVLLSLGFKDVDARHKAGHDEREKGVLNDHRDYCNIRS